jgi:uncharacterized protein (TIGR02599 family)
VTLLETLATLLVLALIFAALLQFMSSVDRTWQVASEDPFAEAEQAFETIAQNLSVATLEPYRDYADATGAFRTAGSAGFMPYGMKRHSDLDFVCGPSGGTSGLLAGSGRTTVTSSVFFTVPGGETETLAQQGMGHLLNALGYFVEFGGDTAAPQFLLGTSRLRWRLKQVLQPSESLQVFSDPTSSAWVGQLAGPAASPVTLAENVIALIVEPEGAATGAGATLPSTYVYDSRDPGNAVTFSQLPPRVHLALAAIDEASALRLAAASGSGAPALVPSGAFQNAGQLPADLTALDAALTTAKIAHRILQRDIAITTAAWSNSP